MSQRTKVRSAPPRSRSSGSQRRKSARRQKLSPWAWLAFAAPVLVIAAIVAIGITTFEPEHGLLGQEAPRFSLPTTAGTDVALNDVLASGNEAMLYFSMGVGCDGCFAQIPEIDRALAERGITLVSVMVDPPDLVAAEASRFGISQPILIDRSRAVSQSYDMLGVYGHTDRPSHSFALVGRDGRVRWIRHYATMFVPAHELLAELPGA